MTDQKRSELENAGPENAGQDRGGHARPETDRPNRKAEKCRTWKMSDQIAGVENAGLEYDGPKPKSWKMQDLKKATNLRQSLPTALNNAAGIVQSPPSSVRPFVSTLSSELTNS